MVLSAYKELRNFRKKYKELHELNAFHDLIDSLSSRLILAGKACRSAVGCGRVRLGMARFGKAVGARHGAVWSGVVWRGLVWQAWQGRVRCGVLGRGMAGQVLGGAASDG